MLTLPLCPAACGSDAALQEETQAGQQSTLHHMVLSIGLVSDSLSGPPTCTQSFLTYCGVSPPHNSLSNPCPINCWSHGWTSNSDPPFRHSALCTMAVPVTGLFRAFLLCWQLLQSSNKNCSQWEPEPPPVQDWIMNHHHLMGRAS